MVPAKLKKLVYIPSGILASLYNILDDSDEKMITYYDVQFLLSLTEMYYSQTRDYQSQDIKPVFFTTPVIFRNPDSEEDEKDNKLYRGIIDDYVTRIADFENFGKNSCFSMCNTNKNDKILMLKRKTQKFEDINAYEFCDMYKNTTKLIESVLENATIRAKLFNEYTYSKKDKSLSTAKAVQKLYSNFYWLSDYNKEHKNEDVSKILNYMETYMNRTKYNVLENDKSYRYNFNKDVFLNCFQKAVSVYTKMDMKTVDNSSVKLAGTLKDNLYLNCTFVD